MVDPTVDSSGAHHVADAARRDLGLSLVQVYLGYVALGGNETRSEVESFLAGETELSHMEFDYLAASINEFSIDAGNDHPVPMSVDFGVVGDLN